MLLSLFGRLALYINQASCHMDAVSSLEVQCDCVVLDLSTLSLSLSLSLSDTEK